MTYQRDMQIIVADLVAERDRLREALESIVGYSDECDEEGGTPSTITLRGIARNALGPKVDERAV